jgi:hypothetical protein
MEAKLIQDSVGDGYIVSTCIEEGDHPDELAIFKGPNALERAIAFAGSDYYEAWHDPQGLSEPAR